MKTFTLIALALLISLGVATAASAQGRGRGQGKPGGQGNAHGRGNPNGNGGSEEEEMDRAKPGKPAKANRDQGSTVTQGDSHGLNTQFGSRGGNRQVTASDNQPRNNGEAHRFGGLARKLNTSPELLQLQYQSALAANPNLKFGQFVAANMIASNHPGITSWMILEGLRNGQSIGQTLHSHGINDAGYTPSPTTSTDLPRSGQVVNGSTRQRPGGSTQGTSSPVKKPKAKP